MVDVGSSFFPEIFDDANDGALYTLWPSTPGMLLAPECAVCCLFVDLFLLVIFGFLVLVFGGALRHVVGCHHGFCWLNRSLSNYFVDFLLCFVEVWGSGDFLLGLVCPPTALGFRFFWLAGVL